MVISGKGVTSSMTLRTKSPNKNKKAKTDIADISNKYFRKLLKHFKKSPYIGYRKKQVHNE